MLEQGHGGRRGSEGNEAGKYHWNPTLNPLSAIKKECEHGAVGNWEPLRIPEHSRCLLYQ